MAPERPESGAPAAPVDLEYAPAGPGHFGLLFEAVQEVAPGARVGVTPSQRGVAVRVVEGDAEAFVVAPPAVETDGGCAHAVARRARQILDSQIADEGEVE